MWCSGSQTQSQDTFPCADQILYVCNLSNHHGDNGPAKISTARWSRDIYAKLWSTCGFRTKYTIYVFTREVTFDKDLSKFLPWNSH